MRYIINQKDWKFIFFLIFQCEFFESNSNFERFDSILKTFEFDRFGKFTSEMVDREKTGRLKLIKIYHKKFSIKIILRQKNLHHVYMCVYCIP